MSQHYTHYLIRHAHRKPFDSNDWGHDLSITSHGRRKAKQLGVALSSIEIDRIWTSPIKRCLQTGEAIRKGLGKDVPISLSSLLGDPGFIISDPQEAGKSFENDSLVELIHKLLMEKTLPGFYSLRLGCSFILKKILSHQTCNQVWISHDFYICLLTCYLFQIVPCHGLMPKFLEGLVFSFEEEGIFAYFRELRTKIALDLWSGM